MNLVMEKEKELKQQENRNLRKGLIIITDTKKSEAAKVPETVFTP